MTTVPQTQQVGEGETRQSRSSRTAPLWRLLSTPAGWFGTFIVVAVVLIALIAPWLPIADPIGLNTGATLQGPNAMHLFGTDELGRDVLSRVVYGSRISLTIAILSIGLACAIGIVLGTSAGMVGGRWEYLIMRLMDALLSFPILILAIAVSVALGHGRMGLIIAIGAVNIPVFTRLTRAQTLQIKEREFVSAAYAIGAGTVHTVRRHIIPNLLNALIVQATTAASFAIIIEAGLSFLGLGIQPPAPSWGIMIADAKTYMSIAPHLMFAPSAALFVTVLGMNLLGDALSDVLDPRMSKE